MNKSINRKSLHLFVLVLASFSFGFMNELNANESKPLCNSEIQLVPSKDVYDVGEPVVARYHNPCINPVYLLKASGLSPIMVLQKWDGEKWQGVDLRSRRMIGITGTSASSHYELDFAQTYEVTFPTKRIIENSLEIRGIYRYSMSVKNAPSQTESMFVTSPVFEIR